jgi:predicted nucleic-acid-binding protein
MVGLDTNVILRYLLQDDPKQTTLANHIVDQVLSDRNPGFISLVTVLETVWVLRSLLKQTPTQIATHLEHLLAADSLEVQNGQQVFEAAFALKRSTGEFENALIGALNAWAGCPHTLTFDDYEDLLAATQSAYNAAQGVFAPIVEGVKDACESEPDCGIPPL